MIDRFHQKFMNCDFFCNIFFGLFYGILLPVIFWIMTIFSKIEDNDIDQICISLGQENLWKINRSTWILMKCHKSAAFLCWGVTTWDTITCHVHCTVSRLMLLQNVCIISIFQKCPYLMMRLCWIHFIVHHSCTSSQHLGIKFITIEQRQIFKYSFEWYQPNSELNHSIIEN